MTGVHRRRLILRFPNPRAYRLRGATMKKPSKTAAELEASIKVEMEDICDWPTDMGNAFSLAKELERISMVGKRNTA